LGLDWIPGARALPGKETEFEGLLIQIKGAKDAELAELNDKLDTISSFKWDVIQFCVAGTDQEADDFLRQVYEEDKPSEPFDQWFEQFRGKKIIDLPKQCDGVPRYSNAGMYEDVDITSFRANFLKDCEEIIGASLLEQAFNMMTASELCTYGKALQERAEEFARKRRIDLVAVDWNGDLATDLERLNIVLCAAKYCLFWGGNGYYVHAWF
jgi:hypothetical protein